MRIKQIGLIGIFGVVLSAWGQTLQPVTTRAFDNRRSAVNTGETILTRDNVLAKGVRRVTIIPVFGDARGTESQPLILPGVKLKDGSTHDVMVLPSMAKYCPRGRMRKRALRCGRQVSAGRSTVAPRLMCT
jgi:hypothetical protein